MNKDINSFIDKYIKEIRNNNAAVFLGAGFSRSAGFVNWKELLRPVAKELELDIEKESNLVNLAQYYCNKNSRAIINDMIFDEFNKNTKITENHKILARLPIFTYWTTNYDTLIEEALKENNKIADVKYTNKHFANTVQNRDAIIYKMHGDKQNPDDAVIIKDDYERYYREHSPFITALSGDLISKTFLFIGFSFTDPNLDYILSRIRVEYDGTPKQHYVLIKKVKEDEYSSIEEYQYASKKQELFIEDLKRYNIKSLIINDYSEITEILTIIENRINSKNIFISGSANEYGKIGKDEALNFIHKLSKRLIEKNYNIISGFGLGVGSAVITGALEQIYMERKYINGSQLLLRPFPQGIVDDKTLVAMWDKYRNDMISRAGISIFLFGNKLDKNKDISILADGVRLEFEIAKKRNNVLVPIGATGYMAEQLWEEVYNNLEEYYPNADDKLKDLFLSLNEYTDCDTLIDNIVLFIDKLQ
ncbi:SIR2 family protein [Intestinibacter sp.]